MSANPVSATADVRDAGFWDPAELRKEFDRVADVCNSCRLCFKFCPSFPRLFDLLDEKDGTAAGLPESAVREVVDLCFQCKLCNVHCPYTPDQGHPFAIDFPRLMLRERLVRARRAGVTFQDRVLGNPDLIGAVGSLTAPISNFAIRSRPVRLLMERTAGIHRDRVLPSFAKETFDRWFRRREKKLRKRVSGSGGKVALFATCSVNYQEPSIGKSAVAVLSHHDIRVAVPEQRCCGMAYLDGGDYNNVIENIRFNLRSFRRFVEEGWTILALQPTCGYVLKNDYPWLDPGDASREMASATQDVVEFLMQRHAEGKLDTSFRRPAGRVLYHLPCHLKAQNIGYKSRELCELISGEPVEMVERCSGMDGTWGMKREYFDASRKVAAPIFRKIQEEQPEHVCSDCVLAGLQIRQGSGKTVRHPVELLREAYGLPLEIPTPSRGDRTEPAPCGEER
ncbi:MAG: heterodisulfide reductase-related iron-sulfur binding cluster [Candidatus Eisenbacteria bacterium]|nr:heterodisulfide reductase-related iron-sulfur binding cluster [Candidatus Eisenbacteria bacterium]